MATQLGKAYVQIVPTTKNIGKNITALLKGELPGVAKQQGEEMGSTMGQSAGNSLSTGLISKAKIAAAAAGAAIMKALKETLEAGADIQQSVGGVETIFKNSADTVENYARTAYSRAGVSANDYMAQVTSFSASLLQSLGGDTAKAAEYADRAMVDMSDNANKFGTDISSIQDAYQGFAKENYTMLDNLKLGYGGTKEEMQRLVSDASNMTDAMNELGVSVDASDMSFGNIINAISVVQKNLDITGTTAKEASTTFSGSFASMKAATTDFLASLTGVTDGSGKAVLKVGKTMNNLIDSVFTFAGNLVPMLASIVANLPGVIVSALKKAVPQLTEAVTNFADSLPDGFQNAIPGMVENGLKAVLKLSETIRSNAHTLVSVGCDLLLKLVQGLAQSLPALIKYAPTIISNLAGLINDNAPTLLLTGAKIIFELAKGIVMAIPTLIANIPQILQAIWDVFCAFNWWNLGKTIIQGIGTGITFLAESIPTALQDIGNTAVTFLKNVNWIELGQTIVTTIWTGIQTLYSLVPNLLRTIGSEGANIFKSINWVEVGATVITWIGNAISASSGFVGSVLRSVGETAVTFFKSIDWAAVGSWLVKGIVAGVSLAGDYLYRSIKNLAKSALDAAKKALGINSPSRVFRDKIGRWIPEGIAVGIEASNSVNKAIRDITDEAVVTASVPLETMRSAAQFGSSAKVSNNTNSTNSSTTINQTINSARALSPAEIARETEDLMRRLKWA